MTVRTYSELLALYATNNAGNLSEADLRDFVDTFFQQRTIHAHASLFAAQSGAGRPIQGQIGAVAYWAFGVDDKFYPHFSLPVELDDSEDIIVSVDVAPTTAQVGKTMKWELSYLVMNGATITINTVDGVLTPVESAVTSTQWEDSSVLFTIPKAHIVAGDHEMHLELKRVASSADAADIAVHHIFAMIKTLPPGA